MPPWFVTPPAVIVPIGATCSSTPGLSEVYWRWITLRGRGVGSFSIDTTMWTPAGSSTCQVSTAVPSEPGKSSTGSGETVLLKPMVGGPNELFTNTGL